MDLTEASAVHTAPAEGLRDRALSAVVRLVLPSGTPCRLSLFRGDAELLVEVLERPVGGRPPAAVPAGPPPRWSRWAVVCPAAGLAILGVHAAMVATADVAVATVVGDDDGLCDVVYPRAGTTPSRAEVDCRNGAAVGSRRTIWVFSDEPGDVADPVVQTVVMAGLGSATALPGALRLLVVRRRRKAWAEGLAAIERTRGPA